MKTFNVHYMTDDGQERSVLIRAKNKTEAIRAAGRKLSPMHGRHGARILRVEEM